MKTLLIIDLANTVIRSVAVHQQLSFNDVPTGGLFGVANQFASCINKYHPTHVLLCRDTPPYLRKQLYPEYKQDRKKQGEGDLFSEMIQVSFKLVEKFFQLFQIPTWGIEGIEADDLIARTTIECNRRSTFDKIYVLSNDDDLNQLLVYDNVTLLRKNKEYTIDSFKQDFPKVRPDDWNLLSAMTGTHNGVKGIPRVGLKTALKYFSDTDPDKLIDVCLQHEDLINRNLELIQLPYPKFDWDSVAVPTLEKPQLNESELIRYLDLYGIRYSQSMTNAFYKYSTRNRTYG